MEKIIFSYTFLLSRKNTNVENEKTSQKGDTDRGTESAKYFFANNKVVRKI